MNQGIIFAIIAGVSASLWGVFHKQASDKVNCLFGAIIVSLVAVVLGLVFLLPKIKKITLFSSPKGLLLVALAGVCALAIDYFTLKAYASGLALTIVGPIITSTGIATTVAIGLLLGESITLVKVVGILFVMIGSGILAALSV